MFNIDNWFMEEVLIHEPVLIRYLSKNTTSDNERDDLCQETYVRVYEYAKHTLPDNTKAFVLSTARNLLIDKARRSQVVSVDLIDDIQNIQQTNVEADIPQQLSSRQELSALKKGLDTLPPKCREVVILRKVAGHSQRDAAKILGVTESTVEKQIHKGVKRLTDFILREFGGFSGTTRKTQNQIRLKDVSQ